MGFSFGGHYAENDNGLTAGVGDQEGWGLGASYDMAGPWSFGIEYFSVKQAMVPVLTRMSMKLSNLPPTGTSAQV